MNSFPVIDFDAYRLFETPNLTGTPERRLLLAILERAILDYVGNDEREAVEAGGWLFDNNDDTPPSEFTFSWICSELDLDLKEITDKIRAMPKRGDSRIAPWYLKKVS